jgi:hypothetical protein
MNKLIRLVVSGLSLCGALAAVPGIADAKEPYRAAPAHVQPGPGRGPHSPARIDHGPVRMERGPARVGGNVRGNERRWGAEHGRLGHERACTVARERGIGGWKLREMGCRGR